jgi:hypothetical protein
MLVFMQIFTGDFNFKDLTARRLCKSFGVKGLILTAIPLPQWLRERACYVIRTLPLLLLQAFGDTRVEGTIINYIHGILREIWSALRLVVPTVSIEIGACETSEPLIQRHIIKYQIT